MGRLIRCPEGVVSGSQVPIVRATGCELVYPGDFDGYFDSPHTTPRTLYAVYRETSGQDYLHWVPLGDYAVVVSMDGSSLGWLFHVADGRITGIQFGCGAKPASYLEDILLSDILLPPQ